MRVFFLKNERETNKFAKILAACFVEADWQRRKEAIVIGLEGELGSGKTTFIKALARGLGIKRRLTSPTFVLMKRYNNFYHFDCYRVKGPKDILELDFKEIISNPKNIIVIEWAEKIKSILPKDKIWIHFKIISNKEREIRIL